MKYFINLKNQLIKKIDISIQNENKILKYKLLY